MFTKKFWKAVPERMVRGGAIAVSAVWIGADGILGIANIHDIGEVAVLFANGAAGSLILSIIGSALGSGEGPSFTGAETVEDA